MAVSVKKIRPAKADITSSLSMLSAAETEPGAKIQTGAEKARKTAPDKAEGRNPASKDTQIIFRTTEANKNSLKGFFASCGLTLSKGIQLACFYFEQQVRAGDIEISPAGLISGKDRM